MASEFKEAIEGLIRVIYPLALAFHLNLLFWFGCPGWGTDEAKLIEQIACRKVEDLIAIRKDFEKQYGKDLIEAIKDDCSGDFENIILALM